MENHKVISSKDNDDFVVTDSFLKLRAKFKELKCSRGRIILVIGSPGTGKSSNIYKALKELNFNYYEPVLFLDNTKKSSLVIFKELMGGIKKDFRVKTKEEMVNKFSKYDAVLIADKIMDSESLNEKKIGLGEWIKNKGLKSLPFYIILFFEYVINKINLNEMNLIVHTTWTFEVKGIKYDLITDFSVLSKIISLILMIFFEVVEISYSEGDTIKIVKNHFRDIDDEKIEYYIKKYGNKPRYILDDLENKTVNRKDLKNPDPVKTTSKSGK
jgi:adenylate kinase